PATRASRARARSSAPTTPPPGCSAPRSGTRGFVIVMRRNSMLRSASRPLFALVAPALLITGLVAAPAAAQVDFSRYVAVGDSLTAGFISGALTQSGQSASYPLQIFRQATGSASGFQQPPVHDPGLPPLP